MTDYLNADANIATFLADMEPIRMGQLIRQLITSQLMPNVFKNMPAGMLDQDGFVDACIKAHHGLIWNETWNDELTENIKDIFRQLNLALKGHELVKTNAGVS